MSDPRSLADRVAPMFAHARKGALRALDVVFPPACLACRSATDSHFALCANCWTHVRFIERPYCERLGTPFDHDLGQPGLVSPQAMADPPVYGRARAAVRYDDGPARLLIARLKFYDRLELARPIGGWMARAGADLLNEADLLVPVPMHRLRLIRRRYNQAALLARAISQETGIPVLAQALTRKKPTVPQVGLSRTQRMANMQGAMLVPEDQAFSVAGRAIVLIDDVMTSGATANAAARALLRAGARSVDVLVFARVVTSG